jgi:predicted metalloprotease with PDZ domain
VPFVERDVSLDSAAAQEMVQRSGQMGVPVITGEGEVIVGFDRPRLEKLAARYAGAAQSPSGGPKLGLVVRDTPAGVEVGRTRPGSPAERAGVRPGDYLETLAGQPVRSVAGLERVNAALPTGQPISLVVRRQGATVPLTLSGS